jgi:RHS repeat-associated protein
VTVAGKPVVVTPGNGFSGTTPIVSGTNTVAITATDPSGNSTTSTYEIPSAGATKTFTYDANGNMTSDGTRTFEWDARNQLVAVSVGTDRSEFTYDGDKRRVRVVEKENSIVESDTRLIWCRTMICEGRDADGATVTRRSFSQGEQATGTTRFFVGDRLGSLDAVTDTSGALSTRYAFDPWGRRTVASGTDITNVGYAGHRWQSASSLSLTLYRAYDAELGRWMSEDPAGREDGPNLYLYAVNQPTRRIDPLGDTSQCCSCSVQVKCRPVGGLIGMFADHCYVVAKDGECKTWYIESGPNGNQNFAGESDSPKGLNATSRSTWTSDTSNADCRVVACMRRSIKNWNSADITYGAMGPNSNSFVSWILTECGMRSGPPPTRRTPGWY